MSPEERFQLALSLREITISCIPIRLDSPKKPAIPSWEPFEVRLPTKNELASWFKNHIRGIAAVGGSVSGGLECIDFDEVGLFDLWARELQSFAPELLEKIVVVNTPKGGQHVWFRSPSCEPNQLLAVRPPTMQEAREFPRIKRYRRIETRGAGGYALLPGSPPECHETGKPYEYATPKTILDVATLTAEERDILIEHSRSYTIAPEPEELPKRRQPQNDSSLSPGDDFDSKANWQEILEPLGWRLERGNWEKGYLIRPGKKVGAGATVGYCVDKRTGVPLLHVFTTSSDIPEGTFGPFRVFAILHHKGDLSSAAKELYQKGFGDRRTRNATDGDRQEKPTINREELPLIINACDLSTMELPEPRFAIPGVLCQGLTILGGRPKQGKSWLSLLLSWAVAGGEVLDGRQCDGGDVLFLGLEDNFRRLQDRIKKLKSQLTWKIPPRLHLVTQWRRADKGGLADLKEWLIAHPQARLIIIDTLAKFRSARKKNSNAYDDDYDELGAIKQLVDAHGISAVVIHHLRKMAAEDPFDEFSGTMGISGAADGLIVLDRKRGSNDAKLYVTGRDIPESTIPITLANRESWRWILKESEEGIDTSGRNIISISKTETDIHRCSEWLRVFLKTYAYPSKELEWAGIASGFKPDIVYRTKSKLGKKGTNEIQNTNKPPISDEGEWWTGLGDQANWTKRPENEAIADPKQESAKQTPQDEESGPDFWPA